VPASRPSANTKLAALMAAAGCTHAGLARRVNDLGGQQGQAPHYDKTAVSHWLSGTQPRPVARYLIAEAIGNKLGRHLTLSELGFEEPESPDCVGKALIFDQDAVLAAETLAELGKMDLDRRSLLKMVPFIGTALLAPQRDWLLALVESETLGPTTVDGDGPAETVRAMIRVFDEMDNRYGGGHARIPAIHYLSTELLPRLSLTYPENQMRQMFTAAAKLAATAGWMTYDVGGYGLGQRYMTQALRLCVEGRDHILAGQIFAGMSHLATNMGNPREGLALARAGIATAKRTGSQLGLMRIYAMRGRAHAALGEGRQAAQSITQAELALDKSRAPQSESEWVQYLDSAYLAAETACCFRDLKDYDNAERFAVTAVKGAGARGRRQVISLSVLATATLRRRNGDVHQAVITAKKALEQLERVSSERSAKALREFRRQLIPYHEEPVVRAFEAEACARLGAA